MPLLFPKSMMGKTPISKLLSLTLRGFGGGLDAVQDDLTMEPRYQKTLNNFRRTPSGAQQIRFGSNWFADLKGVCAGTILDMCYFNGRLVVVTTQGEIATVTDTGVAVAGWNNTLASRLPGNPRGWGNTFVAVDFVPHKDTLVIHNGVDKPLQITSTFQFIYLQDLATGSNVNVPIGQFGCVAQNYHCVAGIPGSPTTIYISAVGTAGVFPGDPAPNDSISIDVGAYAPQGAITIRGLKGYRNYLIVFFQGQSLLVTLGTYNAQNQHTPQFPDTLPKFGLLGHRCTTPIEKDYVFTGLDGYSDASRNLFSGQIVSNHVSDRIEPLYRRITGNLTNAQQQFNCFLVHDPLWKDTILFNPSGTHFVHTGSENLHYSSWSTFTFPTLWTCACISFLGRLFYAAGTKIFQHGNMVFNGENYNADRMNDRDGYWNTSTNFTAGQIIRDQAMNFIENSNDFINNSPDQSWFDSNAVRSFAGNVTAPDGTLTGAMWQRTVTTGPFSTPAWQNLVNQQLGIYAFQSIPFTFSMYAKQGTGRYLQMAMQTPDATGNATVVFDLQAGTIAQPVASGNPANPFANMNAGMTPAPNGWYRCWITGTNPPLNPAGQINCLFGFSQSNVYLQVADAINNSNGFMWGMQLEQGTTAGLYIPTGSAQIFPGNNVSYTCNVTHTSGTVSFATDRLNNPAWWTAYNGIAIPFEMELPWMSGKNAMKVKQLRFAEFGTIGTAEFTVECYTDHRYKDDQGNQIVGPSVSMPFIGGTVKGMGYDSGPMGGGRRSDDPRLWNFPLKFKHLKIRVIGSTTKPMQFATASFLYSQGSYKR